MSVTPPTIASIASAGTGTKTYSSSTTSVCTINSSTGVVAFVSVGTCTIGASIAADSSYDTATASTVSFSVVYAVGDTGPGGGIVFYVQASGGTFTSTGSACGATCKYLEAAPSDHSSVVAWCSSTSDLLGVTATGIGSGFANTITADSTCTSGAFQVAADYTNNSKTDWFLPSKDELNQLYQQKTTVGGFSTADYYWSSSEFDASVAWIQFFYVGTQSSYTKSTTYFVRPVRVF